MNDNIYVTMYVCMYTGGEAKSMYFNTYFYQYLYVCLKPWQYDINVLT